MPYLFAVLSIFLLLPLVMFINIGISKKGKLLIILLSFIISALGLLSLISYPLWQSAAIMLLLILVTTYLMNERYEKFLFELNTKEENNHHIFTKEIEKIVILEEEELYTEDELFEDQNQAIFVTEEVAVTVEEELSTIHDEVALIVSNELSTSYEEFTNTEEKLSSILEEMKVKKIDEFTTNSVEVVNLDEMKEEKLQFLNKPSDEILEMKKIDNFMMNFKKNEDEIAIQIEGHSKVVELFDNLNETSNLEVSEIPNLSDIINEIEFEELENSNIILNEAESVYQTEKMDNEAFISEFENELEEIDPRTFSERNDEEKETIIELEEEIIPFKIFVTDPSKTIDLEPMKKAPKKKENYLSEIEKLLEEE
ncbi:hypothetical protein ACFSO7_19920 [Bacillus sp. CGMCC 1.16607]|uniref:hypothetical protein n=1 Tax=Bacillus sp. CGMCC 1.16607 TaxID=3351842 RepID=UPI00363112A8